MFNVTRIAFVANVVCGVWLMLSAIAWRFMPAHAINALVVGALVVALGLLSVRRTAYIEAGNVALSAWLLVSTWALPGGSALLVVNHFIVAALLFGFSAPALAAPELDRPPLTRST